MPFDKRAIDIYVRWITTLDMNINFTTMMDNGYNDMIIWMLDKINSDNIYGSVITKCFYTSDESLYTWFFHNTYIPVDVLVSYFAKEGNINMLLVLKAKKLIPNLNYTSIFKYAILNGHLNILKLLESLGYFPGPKFKVKVNQKPV